MAAGLCDLPLRVPGPRMVGALCLLALLGLSFVPRRVRPRLRFQIEDSDYGGAMVQAVSKAPGPLILPGLLLVYYWLTAGLPLGGPDPQRK